jgi:filamentous hemagglutinin
MPILKNADRAIIDERKVRDYSLNPNHLVGGHKARLIRAKTGLTRVHYKDLIEQIRQGILMCEAKPYRDYKGQSMFTVHISVTGPKGTATLRTGWIYEEENKDAPRLTTAYIAEA